MRRLTTTRETRSATCGEKHRLRFALRHEAIGESANHERIELRERLLELMQERAGLRGRRLQRSSFRGASRVEQTALEVANEGRGRRLQADALDGGHFFFRRVRRASTAALRSLTHFYVYDAQRMSSRDPHRWEWRLPEGTKIEATVDAADGLVTQSEAKAVLLATSRASRFTRRG